MMRLLIRAMAALALISAIGVAQGQSFTQPAAQKPDIKADLVKGDSEAGGRELWIGVRLNLGSGWKTYWKSPGDAGLPTEFDWSGSSNIVEAEVNWPAPTRLSILGFETIGYTHEVLFPVRIKIRDPAVETRIDLKLAIYACSTICVREERELAATIQPGASSDSTIDAWRSKVPQPTSSVLSVLSVERSLTGPASLRIEVASTRPLLEPDVFVEGDPPVSGDKPIVTFDQGNRATLIVNLSGETAESLQTRPVTATIVSDGAAVLAVSPAPRRNAGEAGGSEHPRPAPDIPASLLALIGIALVGGFILNLMPCVFPVLSLKLLSFVHVGTGDRGQVRKGFAASAAGIVVSFLLLAGVLAGMKWAGASVGWGIQFQQPLFLGGMAVVLSLFAASQFGLFHLAVSSGFLTRVTGVAGGTSTASHFLSGFVATLLATPCSAPLVGTAVGFALSQGTAEIFAIFAALGIGMASPYLVVAAFPGLARAIPRPGPWLAHVKRLFGVALLATAGWLLLVLGEVSGQLPAISLGAALASGFIILALSKGVVARKVAIATATIAIIVIVLAAMAPRSQTHDRAEIPWRTFSSRDLHALVGAGRTVFVDVTADWCITCKINKALVIDRQEVAGRLSADVVPMRADWTRPDDEIAGFMREHGRFGIPFNIVFGPAARDGIALPEILSTSTVSAAFNDAAAASNNPQQKQVTP
ncbi:MAG: protein-disulfide reductase DsbD family protein [Bradyrhizobium sp.]|uniref:protein-disulfide reductase DsbD family protein n=1 Tax=Bradyrhizobium sp. TaxID=376 RepID=UPI0027293782|nr:protein-disulfide reductase DsbD domain-containing protein [Bradyrhizobium sp.]MDO8400954.1 protein-disulfide reductase DsbD family protein [Bradyrhizobium sp.]